MKKRFLTKPLLMMVILLLVSVVGCSTTIVYHLPDYSGYLKDTKFPKSIALYIGRIATNIPVDTTIWTTYYTRLDFYSTPLGSIFVKETMQAMSGTFQVVRRTTEESEDARRSFARVNSLDYIVEARIIHYDHFWKGYGTKNWLGLIKGKGGQKFYPIAKAELEVVIEKPDGSVVFSKRAKYESKETEYVDDILSKSRRQAQLKAVCDQTSEAIDGALSEIIKSIKL